MFKPELADQECFDQVRDIIAKCKKSDVQKILPKLEILIREFTYLENILKIHSLDVFTPTKAKLQ